MRTPTTITKWKLMIKVLSQIIRRHFWYSIILFISNFIIAFIIIMNPTSSNTNHSESVVLIQSSTGTGTGFFVNNQGHLLTAAHVVGNDNVVAVISRDGNFFEANILFTDANTDVALLQVSGAGSMPTLLPMGNSDAVLETEEVYVIGFPGGNYSITKGIITEKKSNYLKTDAATNPGNSGGPLISKSSNAIVGMIIATQVIDGNKAEGQHYAIPINSVDNICSQHGFVIH